MENVGGRLKLKYDAPEDTGNEFWLFYTSPRLRHIGFCNNKGSPYKLQYPKTSTKKFELKLWNECLKTAVKIDEEQPFPKSILSVCRLCFSDVLLYFTVTIFFYLFF